MGPPHSRLVPPPAGPARTSRSSFGSAGALTSAHSLAAPSSPPPQRLRPPLRPLPAQALGSCRPRGRRKAEHGTEEKKKAEARRRRETLVWPGAPQRACTAARRDRGRPAGRLFRSLRSPRAAEDYLTSFAQCYPAAMSPYHCPGSPAMHATQVHETSSRSHASPAGARGST